MKDQEAMIPLSFMPCLEQSSREHAVDIGESGELSHTSENGDLLADRIGRHADWSVAIAENLSVMDKTGRDIVMGFILDDGNKSRSQRLNLFNPE